MPNRLGALAAVWESRVFLGKQNGSMFLLSLGSLTPVAAPNVFLAGDRMRKSGFGSVS
jgi:hypothetical protein